ncbi:hypothetical protein CRENBAI_006536 [Crenichthys baileyi]|uniref:Uncharacterized protein n=1 Tax=Crenichthys baileyi TaxID=28760 RepID=A0AAV9SEK3_9TELE
MGRGGGVRPCGGRPRLVAKAPFGPPNNKQHSDSRVADMQACMLHLFPETSIRMRSYDLTGCINYDRMQVFKISRKRD